MKFLKLFLLAIFLVSAPKLVFSEEIFSFEGNVDFLKNEFNVVLDLDERSSVAARAQRTSTKDYHVSLDIEHLKTPFFDLLSKIESSIEFVGEEGSVDGVSQREVLQGTVSSKYSLLNYKPIRELSGRFEIRDKKLYLTALSVGNLACNGYVELTAPYKLDLSVHLFGVGMNDFLHSWGMDKKYESAGAVSGEIKASGTWDRLLLEGNLESRDGFVQTFNYDSIVLNIEGIYPHMDISHSLISKSDGVSFLLDGPFNLKDKANFKKQIKALMVSPVVSNSGSELEWTIKRLRQEDSGTTELKYRLRRDDALGTGTSSVNEIDMLGIERTRKF